MKLHVARSSRSVETISHVYIGYPTKRILALDVAKEERRGKGLKITIKNYEGQLAFASNPSRETPWPSAVIIGHNSWGTPAGPSRRKLIKTLHRPSCLLTGQISQIGDSSIVQPDDSRKDDRTILPRNHHHHHHPWISTKFPPDSRLDDGRKDARISIQTDHPWYDPARPTDSSTS